jgi:predicted DNA-binding ribbon-helix-helix protein
VSLEEAFWKGLREIAQRRGMAVSELVETIDVNRIQSNLSSAIRLFVLGEYQGQIAPRPAEQRSAAVAVA